jgi:hypothetical protein
MNLIIRNLTLCLLFAVVAASGGCQGEKSSADAVVQGTVTIDGALAPRGQVTFYPTDGGPIATGPIHQDGSFSLRIGQGNMVNPDESKIYSGEYVATVVVNAPADKSTNVGEGGPPLAGRRLSSIDYARRETSDLHFTVKSGRNVFPIELKGSQNDSPPEIMTDEKSEEVEGETSQETSSEQGSETETSVEEPVRPSDISEEDFQESSEKELDK